MYSVTVERTIQAPTETVFKTVSNIPQAAKTITAIDSIVMLSEGPIGEGSRWRETRKMFGKEAVEEMWITNWKPHTSYSVEAESCGTHYKTEYTFTPSDDGTRVSMVFSGQPLTLFAKVMAPMGLLMKGTIRKCFERDLADAAAAIEGAID